MAIRVYGLGFRGLGFRGLGFRFFSLPGTFAAEQIIE